MCDCCCVVPQGSAVIFCFGEIDCREGLLTAVQKCKYEVTIFGFLMLLLFLCNGIWLTADIRRGCNGCCQHLRGSVEGT